MNRSVVRYLMRCSVVWLAMPASLDAQSTVTVPKVIRIENSGATAFSANIMAQANYMRAQGDFLVSAANARQINAEAASKEMDNAVKWVHTYFERRRLNREYRAEENPGYLERLEIRKTAYARLIGRNPATVLANDVTDELNFMVEDLLASSSYETFLSTGTHSPAASPDNLALSPSEIHHLRLKESHIAGGSAMVFRADTGQLLETRWPVALRDERFDATRAGFEAAREAAFAELKARKELSLASGRRLRDALDALSDELQSAYPRERLAASSRTFLEYQSSKRFLQSLALATYRLIDTQTEVGFDDSYRFGGDKLLELLQHMMNKGLVFAPPEPGDEATYRRLFVAVRSLYMNGATMPD